MVFTSVVLPADGRPGTGEVEQRPVVLVVDDEPMIRKVVTWVLRRSGYEVMTAPDGKAGLETFQSRDDIALVLSDVVMPRLDGVGMVRELRQHRPDIPVLFMSGYAGHQLPALDDDDLHRLLDKPFTPTQLIERIEQILSAAG